MNGWVWMAVGAALLGADARAGKAVRYGVAPDAPPPVKVIFDTDMETDCDDAGALAVLHALADNGEAEILATVTSAGLPWSASAIDAINTYYGRGSLPIGAPKGKAVRKRSRYARQISEAFPRDLDGAKAPDAVEVYRDVLVKAADRSVVIVTVGYLTNLARLLKAPASPTRPAGADLVRAKVRLWACMGGNFVGRPAVDNLKKSNHNFTYDAKAAHYAVRHWPAPVMFVGREIGSGPSGLKVGSALARAPKANPVRAAYEHYFGGKAKDRHVADPTTVLYAVRGLGDYWDAVTTGTMDLRENMTFRWVPGGDWPRGYLLKKTGPRANDRHIEKVLEQLMLQPPKAR